ncbi:hypothetical protein EDC01DRAFT_755352 [Geopyxis carbonaria]|nr:hypothetical protein EDC01DRAFT_755352 [Geopyxis carbonaria]
MTTLNMGASRPFPTLQVIEAPHDAIGIYEQTANQLEEILINLRPRIRFLHFLCELDGVATVFVIVHGELPQLNSFDLPVVLVEGNIDFEAHREAARNIQWFVKPPPGASIGTKEHPTVSGSIGFYVQDRHNHKKRFILTCAHHFARGVPDNDEHTCEQLKELSSPLPEGTVVEQPSQADRKTFLKKAQKELDHQEAVLSQLRENSPWREGVILAIQNVCEELSGQIESLIKVDHTVGKITNFYELGPDGDNYLDYCLIDVDEDRVGRNTVNGHEILMTVNEFDLKSEDVVKTGRSTGTTVARGTPLKVRMGGFLRCPGKVFKLEAILATGFFGEFCEKGDSGAAVVRGAGALGIIQAVGHPLDMRKHGSVLVATVLPLVELFSRVKSKYGLELELLEDYSRQGFALELE